MANEDALVAALEADDVEAVQAFFREMNEKERRKHAPYCKKLFKKQNKGGWPAVATSVAFLNCGTFAELSKVPMHLFGRLEQLGPVMEERHPEWLDQWAQHLLLSGWAWPVVRQLVRKGLITKPEHPQYILGMINAFGERFRNNRRVREYLDEDPALLEDEVWRLFEVEGNARFSLSLAEGWGWDKALLGCAQDGVLSRERLLRCALEALGRDWGHFQAKWFFALFDKLEPTEAEEIAFSAMLLPLLGMSAPNTVSWAFKRVKKLIRKNAYTDTQLVNGLRPLMGNKGRGHVKGALKLMDKAVQSSPALAEVAAQGALIALQHEAADVQEAALNLIEKHGEDLELSELLKEYVELVCASQRSRIEGLIGGSEDEAEDSTVESKPDLEALTAKVKQVPEELSHLFQLHELMAQSKEVMPVVPAAVFDGTELPRLQGQECLAPLDDFDELLEIAAQVLENTSSPEDLERLLDAISRMGSERPDDFDRKMAPLLKRSLQLVKRWYEPFTAEGPATDLCGLLHVWAGDDIPTQERPSGQEARIVRYKPDDYLHRYKMDGIASVLGQRLLEIAVRLAQGQRARLLSLPTHTGGFIHPIELVKRVNQWSGWPPTTLDVELTLLRLAPEQHAEALAKLTTESSEEWVQAIRHALGAKVTVGTTLGLWAAAARARGPWQADTSVDGAFPQAGPYVGKPASHEYSFEPESWTSEYSEKERTVFYPVFSQSGPELPNASCLTQAIAPSSNKRALGFVSFPRMRAECGDAHARWLASIWPTAREGFFHGAFIKLYWNLNWGEAEWANKTLLEPLLEAGTPLRDMGALLLVTGLAAKEPGEYGLATDATITAIEDGRLGSNNLGATLTKLVPVEHFKAGRWAKTLGEVARVSDAHALVIKLALEQCLPALKQPPRDVAKLVALLNELCIRFEHGVSEEHQAILQSIKGSNKLAKLAKSLAKISTESNNPRVLSALGELTDLRADSALRWT